MRRSRKLELKLLHSAAAGSLKKVKKLLSSRIEESSEEESESGHEDGYDSRGKEGRSRRSKHREKRRKEKKKRKRDRRGMVDVNCVDTEGMAPLHHACYVGSTKIAVYLVKHGADVHAQDAMGDSPAHIAARLGHSDVLRVLREAGAAMDLVNSSGETPMHLHEIRLDALMRGKRFQAGTRGLSYAADGWEDRLAGEVSADEAMVGPSYWGGGSCPEDWESRELGDECEDDTWREAIAQAMAQKQHERARMLEEEAVRQGERQRKRVREEEKEKARGLGGTEGDTRSERRGPMGPFPDQVGDMRRRMAEEKQRSAQALLREEEAKDRAWRERVAQGKSARAWDDYEARWASFSSSSSSSAPPSNAAATVATELTTPGTSRGALLAFRDVPFPVARGCEGDLATVLLLHTLTPAERRRRLRDEILRWHPDKFAQRWGQRLAPTEQAAILSRVKEIAQTIHELYAKHKDKTSEA